MKSIRLKLFTAFCLIFVLFVAQLAYVTYEILVHGNKVQTIEKLALPTALKADEIKLSVIQVQQWLTDISATRAAKGLDDGFDKAEEHAQLFYKNIDQLGSLESTDPQKLKDIKSSFNSYYETGKKMAHDYIEGGPQKGNMTMGEFDGYAEDINKKVDNFRDEALSNINKTVVELSQTISLLKKTVITLSIIIFLLSMFISFKLSQSITNPLIELLKRTKEIAKGNLTNPVQATTKDEVGQLSQSFEDMRRSLVELINQMNTLSYELNESSYELSEAANQTGETSSQVAVTINEIADGTSQQADTTANVLQKMEKAMKQTEIGYGQVGQTLQNAMESTKVAYEGDKAISESIQHLNTVSKTVQFATESIQKLGRRSDEIGGIITIIGDIANQTNLLALNAAIEAARAGEQGKGFAVVADEVRKLAEESSKATSQITNMIKDIQTEIVTTVQTMESTLGAVENQVQIIQCGSQSLNTIVNRVEETEENMKQIKEIFDNLRKNASDVLQCIREVVVITEEAAAASQQVAASAEEQSSTVEEVAANANQLSNLAESLKREINRFKI